MNSSWHQRFRHSRTGLFGKVAFVCALVSMLSVGLSVLLFQRQVQQAAIIPLYTEGRTLQHTLAGMVIDKMNDETELVVQCQNFCRFDNNVRYIVLQPLNGETMIFRPGAWTLGGVPPELAQPESRIPAKALDPWTGEPLLTFCQVLEVASVPWGHVQVGLSLESSRRAMTKSLTNIATTAFAGIIIVLVGAFTTARRIVRPVRDLSDLARRLADGELHARAEIETKDEIQDLAESMNRMANGIHRQNLKLQQRADRERELGSINAAFLSADPARLDETFTAALATLGSQFNVSAAAVLLHSPDREHLVRAWEWRQSGEPANAPAPYPKSKLQWLLTKLQSDGLIILRTLSELPPEAATEKLLMERHLFTSAAVAPLGPAGQASGFLILGTRSSNHAWKPEDESYLRVAAVTLSNALAHRDAARDRDRLQAQLLQAQKMEAVGKLSGGIAHDFNNMLVPIMGYSDSLLSSLPPGSACLEEIREIKRAAESAAALTRQLLTFSRKQIISRIEVDLNQLVLTLRNMLRRLIGENINLTTLLALDAWTVLADVGQVEQCLVNLCVNARHAIPETGTITIRSEMLDHETVALLPRHIRRPNGLFLRLSVADSGCGMDEATIARIFEPFYSTKGADGTGLGLSVVHGVMEQHGGWIDVQSTPGEGTTFHLYFPALNEPAKPLSRITEAVKVATPIPRGTGQNILLIEDESGVLAFVTAALRQHGYHVTAADSGQTARALFAEQGHKFDLVMSDVVLPDASGIDLLEGFFSQRPDLRAMLSSGYSEKSALVEMVRARGIQFLHKPYILSTLLQSVHRALTETTRAESVLTVVA
ncbi:MAG: multi-sensor hybrid histidine kinase [Verrucomicrobiales bacterium]|nr:multi-sensor hybrid histidine kinase [Verrucomicrobiales bacterium]